MFPRFLQEFSLQDMWFFLVAIMLVIVLLGQ
jgi:hypothetical protein